MKRMEVLTQVFIQYLILRKHFFPQHNNDVMALTTECGDV